MSSARLGQRRVGEFKTPISKPAPLGPEHSPWFWNPRRAGIKFAPEGFRDKLKTEMGEELEVTWNPLLERWQIWSKAPRIEHPICQGWKLLFIHNAPDGGYLPLDERVFARLYSASAAKWGSGKAYFDHVTTEYWRDQAKKEKRLTQEAIDQAMPFFEHSQIKNIGKGNKFSTYHS